MHKVKDDDDKMMLCIWDQTHNPLSTEPVG
jgi:hypothetical protein